jgi:hypothetical protein
VVDDDVVVDGNQRRPVGRADLAGGTGAAVDATEDDDDDDEEGQFEGAGDDFGEAVGLDAEGINDDEEEGDEEEEDAGFDASWRGPVCCFGGGADY